MTVGQLLESLDTAQDDAERMALLNDAPRRVREQLRAALFYRKFMSDLETAVATQQAAFDAFSRQVDAALDDDARLRIIAGAEADPQRGCKWLAEWSWRLHATVEHWRKRYLAACCYGESSSGSSFD